ncbi:MAG: T9SS type A sorting domain-containing protein [Nonlabens sp.]|uniref:T9SS type A sorting domain-containing protein n=1 Tax=Nonlabens sp. TaxID=1888209 RepID=UPI003EF0D115
MKKLLLIITFLFSLFSSAQIFVDASATGANDGTSWTNAYTDLNVALTNHSGSTFWIAAGDYIPGSSVTSRFILNANTQLYGGFNGTESSLSQRDFNVNVTTLSGDLLNNDAGTLDYSNATKIDNAYKIAQVGGSGVIVDGLTFKGGTAIGSSNSDREGSAFIMQKDTQIRNCIFEENIAARGGTVNIGGPQSGATAIIENTIFRNNLASFANTFYSTRDDVSLLMVNVQVTNNENTNFSGVSGFGGLIWLRPTTGTNNIRIVNSTMADNTFNNNSGTLALVQLAATSATGVFRFDNNIFWNNGAGYKVFHIQSGGSASIDVNNNIDEDDFSNINPNATTTVNNTITTDPLFTNNITGDYKPLNSSPAVNTGENGLYASSFPLKTRSGEDRIKAAVIDRGAVESDATQVNLSIGVFVDINASGNNDGTSWQDAYTDLDTALNLGSGNFIWVAQGDYTIPATTPSYQIFTNTKMYGGFDTTENFLDERDYLLNTTTLSGDRNDDDNNLLEFSATAATKTDNAKRVLIARGPGVEIDGFTISGGHAFDSAQGLQEGAGLIIALDTKVRNCIIENNTAQRAGAGIRVYDITGIDNGTNVISNCIFRNNRSWFAGGFYSDTSRRTHKVELLGCSFENNITGRTDTNNNPAGIVWIRNQATGTPVQSDFTLKNCTIAGNNGVHAGTGRYAHLHVSKQSGNTEFQVTNSIFYDNLQTASNSAVSTPVVSFAGGNRNLLIQNNYDEDDFSNLSSSAFNTQSGLPGFINAAASDYRITNSSNAAGNSNQVYTDDVPTVDYFGLARNNNGFDVGAYSSLSTASNNDADLPQVKLYPNPASDVITVAVENHAFAKADIYNLQGQLIAASQESTINVADLSAGMYILQITTTNGAVASKQFIKK